MSTAGCPIWLTPCCHLFLAHVRLSSISSFWVVPWLALHLFSSTVLFFAIQNLSDWGRFSRSHNSWGLCGLEVQTEPVQTVLVLQVLTMVCELRSLCRATLTPASTLICMRPRSTMDPCCTTTSSLLTMWLPSTATPTTLTLNRLTVNIVIFVQKITLVVALCFIAARCSALAQHLLWWRGCLSVCLSRSCIVTKRLSRPSCDLHQIVAQPF